MKNGFWLWARENPILAVVTIVMIAWSIEGIVGSVAKALSH